MKKTILFKTMLLLCALIVGSSSAWAEEVIDELDNAFTGVTGTSYSSWSGKTSNSSAVYAGNSAGGNSSIQLRSNNNNAGVVTTASGGKVKSIKVFWNSNTTATRTLNIYGKNEAYEATTDLYNNSKQGTLLGTLKCEDADEGVSVLTIEGDYEFIGFRSASGALYLDKVEITWETGDPSDPSVATTVTINDSSLTNTDVYEGTEAGLLNATVKAGDDTIEGATVTWSSSNENVATIGETTGIVTLVAAGTTTITASYAGVENEYKPSNNTYELTVTNSDPNVPGTLNNPYTVAQAKENTPTTSEVYIKGIVCGFYKDDILSDGTNYRYYISDDGTTTDKLLVYKGKNLNNEAFVNADDIEIGDNVVIYGKLTTYNNDSEIAAGNYLVSLDRPIVSTITVAETSIEVPVEGGKGTINVTYDNFNDIVADIAFYEADGTTPATYDWIEATINDENNIEYVVVENDGPSRKAYLKVYALDDNTEEVYSELITITQAKFVPAPTTNTYTLTTTVVPGRHYIIVSGEDNGYFYAMGEQKDNNRGTVTITVNEGTTTISSDAGVSEFLVNVDQDGYFTIYDDNREGYLYAAGAGTKNNQLKTQAENDEKGQWMITFDENGAAIVKANASGRNWMRYNDAKNNLFSCYGSGQQDIFLYERDGDTGSQNLTVNISDACTDGEKFYTTYSAPFAYQITGATVYGVSIEEGKLSLNEITADAIIPAYSGVLISSDEPGAKDIVTAKGGAALQNDVNWLLPTLWGVTADDMTGDNLFYRLTMHNGTEIGFWWGAADGAAFNLAANKAYLAVPKDVEAREGWWFDSETTGIKTVENAASSINGEVYNLAGQRVAQPAKGLYIVNGKKVVVK